MPPFLERKKKMMNANGMLIVTEILQAWILNTRFDAGYYDNLNYRKCPFSCQAVFPQDHFKPPKNSVHELPVTINISMSLVQKSSLLDT